MVDLILHKDCFSLRVMLGLFLMSFVILITASQANAQYGEYRAIELENNTLYISPPLTGYYYIYPVNPRNIPMELEIEFTNNRQIVKNTGELETVIVPPYSFNYSFPVEVELDIPASGFTGDIFFVEYVIYEKDGDLKERYGPRGMFNVKIVPVAAPSWDVVALRASYFTLLTIILVVSTIYLFKRYFFRPEQEQ